MAMKIDRFTEKARDALGRAHEMAQEHNHPQVDAEHLLSALLEQDGGIVPEIITKIGGNPSLLRSQVMSCAPSCSWDRTASMSPARTALARVAIDEPKR